MHHATTRRLVLAGSVLGAAGLGWGARAQVQGGPDKLVRLVVPFSPGSTTDLLARAIAPLLATRWNQQVITDNRPGIPGMAAVAKSPNDGSVLMLTSNGHSVLTAVNPNLGFDPVKDFAAITQVATQPSILIVPADSPYRTVQDLIAAAQKPDALNFASAGVSSSTGIASLLFTQVAGVKLVHVPFRGLPEMHTAVIRADAAMAFTFFAGGGDLILGGKLRALAVTGDRRMAQLPDVPTFAEAGLPQFRYDAWFGILAPTGLSAALQAEVASAVAAVLKNEELAARFGAQGVVLTANTPAQFAAQVQADAERYGPLVKSAAG